MWLILENVPWGAEKKFLSGKSFHWTGYVDRYCLNPFLAWNVLFPMSMECSCIPTLSKAFIMKGCWILSNAFSASNEMIMCCYISNFISDFINLDALSLPFVSSGRSVYWLDLPSSAFCRLVMWIGIVQIWFLSWNVLFTMSMVFNYYMILVLSCSKHFSRRPIFCNQGYKKCLCLSELLLVQSVLSVSVSQGTTLGPIVSLGLIGAD
ncbi:hypothetical protein STEG23_019714 [Scotinomys teguina]